MTEGRAFALAAFLHVLLLAVLSLGILNRLPQHLSEPDVIPVQFLEITDTPQARTPPKPSMDAAPHEATPGPPTPPSAPEPDDAPEVRPRDTAPQDAVAEVPEPKPDKPQPEPKKPAPAKKPAATAALIDKSKPEAPAKPRTTADFAKTIEQAIPKQAELSSLQAATLEQAIRAQIAPCWNPPIGGADVAQMTVKLRIRLNHDGSIAAAPEFVSQTGATAGNQAYARAFVETAKRAVLRCAPLELPEKLFPYWRDFILNFDPRLMT